MNLSHKILEYMIILLIFFSKVGIFTDEQFIFFCKFVSDIVLYFFKVS